ncbi:MAG: DUF6152 family protein [Steroidobacteraceae bacterium]
MISRFRGLLPGLSAGLLLAMPFSAADAHHSAVAYDLSARATLSGVVKSFEWENPHCWLVLAVPDGKGGTEEWRLEGGSVSILVRNGWRSDIVAVGDKVKVLISPRKDKAPGGEFYTVLEKNGQPLVLGNVPQA